MSDAPPARYLHEKKGTGLRLQSFLILRDDEDRIHAQRIEEYPDSWLLPGEMLQEGEDPEDGARRVADMYLDAEVGDPELVDVLSYAPTEDNPKWYLIFVFEADAPEDLSYPDDTLEATFNDPSDPPTPLGFDHATVWEAVTGNRPGLDVA